MTDQAHYPGVQERLWVGLATACLLLAGCSEPRVDSADSRDRSSTNPTAPAVADAPVGTVPPATPDNPSAGTEQPENPTGAAGQPEQPGDSDSAAEKRVAAATPTDKPASDASPQPKSEQPAAASSPADPLGTPQPETPPAGDNSATAAPGSNTKAAAAAAGPRKVELLIKSRVFTPEADGALRVSYDDLDLLKVLNMEPVTTDAADKMPGWLKGLHGQRIRIRGFMYPPPLESGIPQFVLARDNEICCFGRNPKIYDLIAVSMKAGTTTNYIQNRPFDVVGTFRIEMIQLDDGTIFGLYHIDNAQVIEK